MRRYRLVLMLLTMISICPLLIYGANEKPIAVFSFSKASYQVNEPIEVIEESYSPIGNKITKREWMIVADGKKKTSSYANDLFSNVKKGQYELFLRVRDTKDNWSNWSSKKISIVGSKPFKLTSFKTEQSSYAIGEKLQLKYTYDNPNGLNIKGQRWRYRNITTNGNLTSGKPKYFRKAGTYEISLELQDDWGNWSNKLTCKVNITTEKVQRNGYYLFNRGRQGDLIEGYIDKDYNTFDVAEKVQVEDVPGTLIMSNSPESVKASGILYRDTTSGKGIMTVHHLNYTNFPKKLVILATTTEETPVTLTISNQAIYGPHKNILETGQKSVRGYFNGNKDKNYTVKPNQTVCIYDSSKTKVWNKWEVVSGMFDFNSSGKVTWTVVMMDEQSTLANVNKLSVLPRDVHTRGTFDVIQRNYVIDLSHIEKSFKLVIGREESEWLEGVDALTGDVVKNKGNYGLPINIQVKNTEDIGIILNARGGGYLGAIRWQRNKVFDVPNEDFLSTQKLAALIGKAPAGQVTSIDYTLPNGSSAPVLFGFIPSNLWK